MTCLRDQGCVLGQVLNPPSGGICFPDQFQRGSIRGCAGEAKSFSGSQMDQFSFLSLGRDKIPELILIGDICIRQGDGESSVGPGLCRPKEL